MLRMSGKELSELLKMNPGKPSKYGNRRVQWQGIQFDSIRERDRYIELSAMEQAGEISDLRRQVPYVLIPEQRDGRKIIERSVSYIADFTYRDSKKRLVVEDAKGFRKNPVWIIKRKMMLWLYGIRVKEV